MTTPRQPSISVGDSYYELDPAVDVSTLQTDLLSALADGTALAVPVLDQGRPLILLVNGRVTPTVLIDPGAAPSENVPKGEISNW
jgi:hypothetical protein